MRAGGAPPSDYFRPFQLQLAPFSGKRSANVPAEMSWPQRVEKDVTQVRNNLVLVDLFLLFECVYVFVCRASGEDFSGPLAVALPANTPGGQENPARGDSQAGPGGALLGAAARLSPADSPRL